MKDYRQGFRGNTLTTDEIGGIVLGRENEVKRAGYRSTLDQITELTRAGQRLQTAREEQYAKPTGITPRMYGEIDRTVADEKIQSIKEKIVERKTTAQKEAEEKAAPEAASKAEPATQGGGVT